MAQPADTFSTYDAIGNREDLADIIYDISPTETPFLSTIPKTTATGTKHEWQTDALAAASGSNAVIEGDDATTDAATATVRVFNYTQISDKVPRVTGTQEDVDKAGRASEMAYQMEKRMKEIKRDVETMLLQNVAEVAGNDTLARKASGAQTWIVTNTNIAADATAATGDGTDAHTDGTARALQESFVEEVLGEAWNSGGNPTMGILGKAQKQKFAAFSGNATRTHEGETKKITNTIDIYIDPLGNEIRLVPDRFAPVDVVYFFDTEMVKFATLRDFRTKDLAVTGDSIRKQIPVESTLHMSNEAAHAGIYDLT
ncbi:DUF5309 domain-containing protein [Candidatus Pacearchaeota archaeon]|nr:DUF5309 domain-containing protein [Candidatus Pacearchaeota archaeon]